MSVSRRGDPGCNSVIASDTLADFFPAIVLARGKSEKSHTLIKACLVCAERAR